MMVSGFLSALADLPVLAAAEHVAEDLSALSQAFADDDAFRQALVEVMAEFRRILADPGRGTAMHGHYAQWRRVAFQSERARGHPADLRIVYRPMQGRPAIEVRAFGHRWHRAAIYLRSKDR